MQTYSWWDQVPESLKTKTQLGEMGYKPGGLPRAEIEYGRGRKHRIYDLYDVSEAIAKQATPAQLAALEQARLAQRTCKRCGKVVEKPSHLSARGNCGTCRGEIAAKKRTKEVASMRDWARALLASPDALILDSETTGLDGYLCEISIIRMDGSTVLNTLVNPQEPNGATHIHGITDDMTWSAPTFEQLEPELRRILHGHTVVVYNAVFDSGVLEREVRRLCMPSAQQLAWLVETDWGEWGQNNIYLREWQGESRWLRIIRDGARDYRYLVDEHADWWIGRSDWQCAMEAYATYVGEWHDSYHDYRYQPLGGGHRALGDCLTCLNVLIEMAATVGLTEGGTSP